MQEKINIFNELNEAGAVFLTSINNRNLFTVPEDYFNNLPDNIFSHVFIKSLPAVNPYTIPEGYFENLPEVLLDKLSVSSFNGNKKEVFSVPQGYFNNLAENILKKIKAPVSTSVQQELSEISPFLSTISKANVYSVSENYFEELDASTVTGNQEKPVAKVVSIGRLRRRWLGYAAAACIAALAFSGGYFYFSSTNSNRTTASLTQTDVQKEISVLSDDEIANYLKDNNNVAVYTNVSDDDQQQQSMDVQDLLQNVSDEEIQQYLNQDPESAKGEGGI